MDETLIFDWDETKSQATLAERGFSFAEAALVFADEARLTLHAGFDPYGGERVQVLGQVAGVLLSVVVTERQGVMRIISARRASRKERSHYGEIDPRP